jgi:tetratricopeptide (TPR) repeat protein
MPMPGTLTVAERIVLHLSQQQKFKDSYDVPFDVSQDGIAQALLISRAHAAVELKKLKESGEVHERLAHIKKGKNKRKVYFLTTTGEEKAEKIRGFAEERGIDVGPCVDVRRARGSEVWRSLSEDNKKVLAAASVFRIPFKREALPETSVPLLPVDRNGYVDLPSELKVEVQAILTKEQAKSLHSFAADYWLKEGDYRERLFHLLEAGRSREAEMLVAGKGAQLLKEADEDLLEDLSRLQISERYGFRTVPVQAECARLVKDYDYCTQLCEELISSKDQKERYEGLLIKGKALRDMGRLDEALSVLGKAKSLAEVDTDSRLEVEIAEVLIGQGRHEEGLLAIRSLSFADGSGDPELLERACLLMAKAHLGTGNADDAIRYASKSLAMTQSPDKRPWYEVLALAYERIGLKDKAKEFEAKAHPPKKWGEA